MPAVYELSVTVTPSDAPARRESITCDRPMAVNWLREMADGLEENDTAVVTRPPANITGDADPRGFDCPVAQRTGFQCMDHRWHGAVS